MNRLVKMQTDTMLTTQFEKLQYQINYMSKTPVKNDPFKLYQRYESGILVFVNKAKDLGWSAD